MQRLQVHSAETKLRIVLSVLSREMTTAEAARQYGIPETSIATWKDQFLADGTVGLEQPDVSLPNTTMVLAGLVITAGTIHLVAFVQHVSLSWMLGAFFALVGAGQLFAAWWIYSKPHDRRMLKVTAAASVGVALLWVISRTLGLPFGPDAGKVSSVGVADTIATAQELAFAAIVVATGRQSEQGGERLGWVSSEIGTRLTFGVLSATLLVAAMGGHEH